MHSSLFVFHLLSITMNINLEASKVYECTKTEIEAISVISCIYSNA